MFYLKIDYPEISDEVSIVQKTTTNEPNNLGKVMSIKDVMTYQELVRRVPIADNVIEYAVRLVSSTRITNPDSPSFIKEWVDWGAGPRASQYLVLGAKARPILDGRPTPDIDDIRSLALPVFVGLDFEFFLTCRHFYHLSARSLHHKS